MVLVAVVVLGVTMVFFARTLRAPAEAPRVGNDHWHSAYAFYDCDRYLPALTSQADPDGIHSHADGVIHIHPWNSSAAGKGATLDIFSEAMGVRVSDDEISGPGIGVLEAGSTCNGEPTVIRAARFESSAAQDLSPDDSLANLSELFVLSDEYDDDFGDIRLLGDFEAFTFARIPVSAEIPPPPEERLQQALVSSAGNLLSSGPETGAVPEG